MAPIWQVRTNTKLVGVSILLYPLGNTWNWSPESGSVSEPYGPTLPSELLQDMNGCWAIMFTAVILWRHLSDLAIIILNDFHLTWPIHGFPPTLRPTALNKIPRERSRGCKLFPLNTTNPIWKIEIYVDTVLSANFHFISDLHTRLKKMKDGQIMRC